MLTRMRLTREGRPLCIVLRVKGTLRSCLNYFSTLILTQTPLFQNTEVLPYTVRFVPYCCCPPTKAAALDAQFVVSCLTLLGAGSYGFGQVVALLLAYGARLSVKNNAGLNPHQEMIGIQDFMILFITRVQLMQLLPTKFSCLMDVMD